MTVGNGSFVRHGKLKDVAVESKDICEIQRSASLPMTVVLMLSVSFSS